MKENRNLTCIICPKGCQLTVSFKPDGSVDKVEGHTCKRGELYAVNECTHPTRTITTTVRCKDGSVVPVKTSTAVPKELIFEVMSLINKTVAPGDIKIGDVILSQVLGTDADVVVTGKKSK